MGPGAVSTMVLATTLAFFACVCSVVVAAAALLPRDGTWFAISAGAFGAPLLLTAIAARSSFRRAVTALLARRAEEAVPLFAREAHSVDAME